MAIRSPSGDQHTRQVTSPGSRAEAKWGRIADWDVSEVTSIFRGKRKFVQSSTPTSARGIRIFQTFAEFIVDFVTPPQFALSVWLPCGVSGPFISHNTDFYQQS